MFNSNFDFIWKEIILKSALSIYNEIPEEDRKKYDLFLREEKKLKKSISKHYETEKYKLKKHYYSGGRIDEHKIAACLCSSIIKNKMISYRLSTDLPESIFFINYKIAYFSSLGIIYLYLLNYYLNKNDSIYRMLKDRENLASPCTTEGHDPYDMCIIKMLTMNDIYGNGFDVLAYSNIMFSLEEFNKVFMENNYNLIQKEKEM